MIPSSGESAIDLRGRIARTSLPFSAGGITTFAGAGAGRRAGLGAGVVSAGGVALGAVCPDGASGAEPVATGAASGSALGGAVRAALSPAGLVESLCSSGSVSGFAVGLGSLDPIVGDGFSFLERAGAVVAAGAVLFLELDSGGGAFWSS